MSQEYIQMPTQENKFNYLLKEKKYEDIYSTTWNFNVLPLDLDFNNELNGFIFPDCVEKLYFGRDFNKKVDKIKLPNKLKELHFGVEFNQPVDNLIIPDTVLHIYFGTNFNQPLDKLKLPLNLHTIEFGEGFNQSLNLNYPDGFSTMKLYNTSNSITMNSLPHKLKKLYISSLTKPLENLPINLEFVDIWYDDDNNLEKSKIPFGTKVFLEDIIEW